MVHAAAQTCSAEHCDVLLLGGGLANSLIALELRRRRPELRVVLVERRRGFDSLHTWCIFRPDVSDAGWSVLERQFDYRWSGYTVAFPDYTRIFSTGYACVTGLTLSAAVAQALREDLLVGSDVEEAGAQGARLADGRHFLAPLVIDGRGWRGSGALRCGWQKFAGLECRLVQTHSLDRPVVMDATADQKDGFRFLYTLPLGPDRLLIEDTRYSGSSALDVSDLESEIHRYADAKGWRIAEIERRENGVLPVVLGGDLQAFLSEQGAIPTVGLRGGFFHPTTGYSLAQAAETAAHIAAMPRLNSAAVAGELRQRASAAWNEARFYRGLNRMLFHAAAPHERRQIMQRFYQLPQPLIERFYGRRITLADKARILLGRPPVPISAALRALWNAPKDTALHA